VRRSLLGLATAGLILAGCTTDLSAPIDAEAYECRPGTEGCDEIRPIGPGGQLEVDMGSYWFEWIDGIAVTGEIEVIAHNVSSEYHNIEFLGAAEGSEFMGGTDGEAVAGAMANETDEGVVALFPGEWTVICNVPGHRAAGMEATITIYATEDEADEALEEFGPTGQPADEADMAG
jgi:plastocyanin